MPVVRGKEIEVLFSASAIARRNLELAKEIAGKDYHDLLVISVLKGSFIFAADLIRAMHDVGLSRWWAALSQRPSLLRTDPGLPSA